MRHILVTTLTALLIQGGLTYNILGIFPSMSRSHFIAGSALMKGLAADGHNVSVISPFPQSKPIPNYRDIAVIGIIESLERFNLNLFDFNKHGPLGSVTLYHRMGLLITNVTLYHPKMISFLADTNEHFDVVIVEIFLNDAMLGLGHHFNAPVIGFSPFGSSMWSNDLVGTPMPLSYIPQHFLSYNDQMTFPQRVVNTMMTIIQRISYNQFLVKQQEFYEKTFPGENKPKLEDIRKNVSLVLLNQHFTTNYPLPYVPNMVEVGGIHINREKPNPLPDDIRLFIEGATHGVVYFSMGSNIKGSHLPDTKRDDLLRSFTKLKQRVLWKWEISDLPGKPDNVMISKWFPQDDILAHPNVKVFITHGGLLSMSEAVYNALPIIGIPVFADQYLNMARAQDLGYGLTLGYANLTEKSIDWALNEMLYNNQYSLAAKTVSFRYRDQPLSPLELAKFWVEYVVRHKGAPHMHSSGQDLHFIVYHSIDVFAFLAVTIIILLYVVFWLIAKVLSFAFGSKVSSSRKMTKDNKKRN